MRSRCCSPCFGRGRSDRRRVSTPPQPVIKRFARHVRHGSNDPRPRGNLRRQRSCWPGLPPRKRPCRQRSSPPRHSRRYRRRPSPPRWGRYQHRPASRPYWLGRQRWRPYIVPLAGGGEMTVLATDLAAALDNVVAQGGIPDLPAPESVVNDDAPDAVDVVAEVAAFETAAIAPTPPPPSTIPLPLPPPQPLIVPQQLHSQRRRNSRRQRLQHGPLQQRRHRCRSPSPGCRPGTTSPTRASPTRTSLTSHRRPTRGASRLRKSAQPGGLISIGDSPPRAACQPCSVSHAGADVSGPELPADRSIRRRSRL